MTMRTVDSTTKEKIATNVRTDVDPSGTPPDYSVSQTDVTPGSWVPGTWSTAWDTSTGDITAQSPLLGAGEALDVSTPGDWFLWIRWTAGTEIPVRLVEPIRVV